VLAVAWPLIEEEERKRRFCSVIFGLLKYKP
jgi:hypothetical protein